MAVLLATIRSLSPAKWWRKVLHCIRLASNLRSVSHRFLSLSFCVKSKLNLHIAPFVPDIFLVAVPYRDFFMTIAHLTGGQYVSMVDASRLAQMIISGVREEISLDRATQNSKRDIARVMVKAKADGVDDIEAARRLQKLFSDRKVVVNRMQNESGIPSKAAEECYSKCVDMSDMQQQYQQPQTVTTKSTDMDYKLEEDKTVSLEQAKRIVQKAKAWNYSSIAGAETNGGTPCKHGARCHDTSTYHRARFSHPTNGIPTQRAHQTTSSHPNTTRNGNTLIECKHAERCHDHSEYHRTKFSHPAHESSLKPCRHKDQCHDHSESHRGTFSHAGGDDHRLKCRYGSSCYDKSDQHRKKYSHDS